MESTVPRYRRVVVKLSGEALAGSGSSGVDPASLSRVAEEVLSVHDLGVQVAVVVGGGNYFRGRMAEGWGISRAEADNIGMLGTIMNALMLRGALTARTDTDVRVMTAVPIQPFRFRDWDLTFIAWLNSTAKSVDFLSDD